MAPTCLGRGDNCDIIVSDPTVSRSHLRVDVGADWSVTVTVDPTAENGLLVNGAKVDRADDRSTATTS